MIQRKSAIAVLFCAGLLAACSKSNNDGPGDPPPPPPPPVDSCLLLKKTIAIDSSTITDEYQYQPGSTDGKFIAVVRTEIRRRTADSKTSITSKSYEHTSNGFTCKRYNGGVGSDKPTHTEIVDFNNKNMPLKAKVSFNSGDEQDWSYNYNEKDELQNIKIKSKNSGDILLKIDWVDGNPVKISLGVPVGNNVPVAMLSVVNEYSDKPFLFNSWKTVDADMSTLYDSYHLQLALKRKNHLKKQVQLLANPLVVKTNTYNDSDLVINKNGKLTGFKIQMKEEASVLGGPVTSTYDEKGTATAKTKCD